ncbi:MAG: flagellar biosynthetic protein FliR [Aquisalinus sp.]|nr:flagellar biosynthetic protein FliR [Aquisalinus sp.]
MEIFQSLAAVIAPFEQYLFAVAAMFVRLSMLAFLVPGLGEGTIPVRGRIIVALVITWLIVPFMLDDLPQNINSVSALVSLMFLEAIYGFVLGFSLRLMIFVLQIAGTIIAQAMSLSQIFGNILTEEPNPTVSLLLMVAGTTLLLTMDFHVEVIGLLVKSYETFPMGTYPDLEQLAYWASGRAAYAFEFALSLSLPFVVLNFIYNVVLGVVNRAMPQLMVSFVGLPAITGASLVLLAISVAAMLMAWVTSFNLVFAEFGGG